VRYQRNSCRRRIESTRGVFEKDTSSTSIQSSPCRCDPLSITTSTGFASTRYPTFVWHIDFLPPPFDNYFQQPRIYHSHFDRPCHNQTIPFSSCITYPSFCTPFGSEPNQSAANRLTVSVSEAVRPLVEVLQATLLGHTTLSPSFSKTTHCWPSGLAHPEQVAITLP